MPWCPNCKTEYKEGVTHCSDCHSELVADYNEVLKLDATELLVAIDARNTGFAQRLCDFLEHSGIICALDDSEEESIGILVRPKDLNKAKRCFKAFYSVESEIVAQKSEEAAALLLKDNEYFGDDDDEADDADSSCCSKNATFVSAATRYEDYRSSGIVFTFLGVIGIAFAVLNFMNVITLFGSGFSAGVLFIMFSIFLILGIVSFRKSDGLKDAMVQETELTAKVKEWLQENVTEESLQEPVTDAASEEVSEEASEEEAEASIVSEELFYLDRLAQIRDSVKEAFPEITDAHADHLIEEFIQANFEK